MAMKLNNFPHPAVIIFGAGATRGGLGHTLPPPPTDTLVERLLDGVKATGLNRDVERSITISVRDKINEPVKTGDAK